MIARMLNTSHVRYVAEVADFVAEPEEKDP